MIGITTDTNRFVVKHKGEVVADIPVQALSDEAPVYERPFAERARRNRRRDVPSTSQARHGVAAEADRLARHGVAPLGLGAI